MLRWLKTVVVNDEEKAPRRCQVGIRKASESESLLTCRNLETTSKPGCQCNPGMSLAAQTVVAQVLEAKAEPVFHPDSYGYRPGRSAIDAVAVCRRRCWKADWVIDLDISAFLDAWSHCSCRSLS